METVTLIFTNLSTILILGREPGENHSQQIEERDRI